MHSTLLYITNLTHSAGEVVPMPTDKKAITVYLNEGLYKLVARSAKADGRSISNYVENALAATQHPEVTRTQFANTAPPDGADK